MSDARIFAYALLDDARDALSGLGRRPLRSILSSIGIAIGVAALVAMMSIGEGGRQQAMEQIASLGVDTVRIESRILEVEHLDRRGANRSLGLTDSSLGPVIGWLGGSHAVGPFVRENDVVLMRGSEVAMGTVLGVDLQWFDAEKLTLESGRSLWSVDGQSRDSVCVVGSFVRSHLNVVPGDSLRLRGNHCRVVGWLEPKGRLITEGTGLSAIDFDRVVVMPRSAFPFARHPFQWDGVVIRLHSADERMVMATAGQIDMQLQERHAGIRDYRIVVPLALMQEVRQTQTIFGLVMGSIAGLSLLVGGIGIMNVMLANIAEQTREIGLRMAVGATRTRIVTLYLWHSVLLTLLGGVMGIAIGFLIALTVQGIAGWPVAFSTGAIVVAPIFAVLTGLVFGLHPAVQAAKLNPAQSLRES